MRSNLTTKLENKAGGRFSNLKNLPTPSKIAVTFLLLVVGLVPILLGAIFSLVWPTVHGRRW